MNELGANGFCVSAQVIYTTPQTILFNDPACEEKRWQSPSA